MSGVSIVSIRRVGGNFGKPLGLESFLNKYIQEDIYELLKQPENIRFFDEDGELLSFEESAKKIVLVLERKAFEACKTIQDYRSFLKVYPKSALIPVVRDKMDDLFFAQCESEDHFKKYLTTFKSGKYRKEASKRLGIEEKPRLALCYGEESDSYNLVNDELKAIKDLEVLNIADIESNPHELLKISATKTPIITMFEKGNFLGSLLSLELANHFNSAIYPCYDQKPALEEIDQFQLSSRLVRLASSELTQFDSTLHNAVNRLVAHLSDRVNTIMQLQPIYVEDQMDLEDIFVD